MSSFIVLEHDLYPQTVDLAIGYTLPAAMSFTPHLTVCPLPRFCIPLTHLLLSIFISDGLHWPLQSYPIHEPISRDKPEHKLPLSEQHER